MMISHTFKENWLFLPQTDLNLKNIDFLLKIVNHSLILPFEIETRTLKNESNNVDNTN